MSGAAIISQLPAVLIISIVVQSSCRDDKYTDDLNLVAKGSYLIILGPYIPYWAPVVILFISSTRVVVKSLISDAQAIKEHFQ